MKTWGEEIREHAAERKAEREFKEWQRQLALRAAAAEFDSLPETEKYEHD